VKKWQALLKLAPVLTAKNRREIDVREKNAGHKSLEIRLMKQPCPEAVKNFLTGWRCWVDFQTRR
jgi:hypothetical protein